MRVARFLSAGLAVLRRYAETMRTEFQTLIRTGKLHQLQAADLALTDAGIPHNLQEESVTGMCTAMPVDPSPFPGTWWAIRVPVNCVNDAQDVIAHLPFNFTTAPDVWDCNPSPRGKRIVSIFIWLAIAAIAIMFVAAALTRA